MATFYHNGGSRPPGRTIPGFLDPTDKFGELTILLMEKVGGGMISDNPFIIGKSIEEAAGDEIEKAYSDGDNYVMHVRNSSQLKRLLKMNRLIDGTEVTVVPHPGLNRCRCVIVCKDLLRMDEKDILDELKSQKVVDVHRILRTVDKEKVKTATLILTLCSTTYPAAIKVGALRVPTRAYYPNPMLCYGCLSYGHTKKRCSGPTRCQNCSEDAQHDDCKNPPHCRNCSENHRPTSRQCKVYQKENLIIKTKTDMNLSFPEARRRVEEQYGRTYAGVTAQDRLAVSQANEEVKTLIAKKDAEITALQQQMEKMKAFIKSKLMDNRSPPEINIPATIDNPITSSNLATKSNTKSDHDKAQTTTQTSGRSTDQKVTQVRQQLNQTSRNPAKRSNPTPVSSKDIPAKQTVVELTEFDISDEEHASIEAIIVEGSGDHNMETTEANPLEL